MAGYAKKIRLLSIPGGIRVDMRGSNTPVPSASRLFIEYKEASKTAIPFARAVLRHAVELVRPHQPDTAWRKWFENLLESVSGLYYWPDAMYLELELIDQVMKYAVRTKGIEDYMSREELVKAYGQWVPVYFKNITEEGLNIVGEYGERQNWATLIMLIFRQRRRRSDGVWEVNMEHLVSPQWDTIEEAMEIWETEIQRDFPK
jgi:hypothetical protein